MYITIAKLKFAKISYLHMAIPYRTSNLKLKSANILAIVILGSTAKFNSHQYFQLYGIKIGIPLLSRCYSRIYTTIYSFPTPLHNLVRYNIIPHCKRFFADLVRHTLLLYLHPHHRYIIANNRMIHAHNITVNDIALKLI